MNVAGSDEAEAVRLLENATAEAVRIKRDAEEEQQQQRQREEKQRCVEAQYHACAAFSSLR